MIKTSNATKHCRNKAKARRKNWFCSENKNTNSHWYFDNKTMSWKYTKEITDSVNKEK